jgi:hypothetical protein
VVHEPYDTYRSGWMWQVSRLLFLVIKQPERHLFGRGYIE